VAHVLAYLELVARGALAVQVVALVAQVLE
jgi:hypothetical protein